MPTPIVEFMVHGSPHAVSHAIESYAAERRVVSALVVPWESTTTRLSMAVTVSRAEGWSIEHTNLGTVTLTEVDGSATEVAVFADDRSVSASGPDKAGAARAASLLDAFARQIKDRFGPPRTHAEQTP